ncbi:hypothetical protein [Bradyrhizobium sp. HKCCYLS20291]|uniref:hypothetical protein n=1 Tax=Bradyrhizobium sp. HKCCYLS20291 TaxID=3420766 RepID=UPI003EBE9C11
MASLAGCQTTEQAEFLEHRRSARDEVVATYPLDKQWRLFKYANQVVHPPMTGLSSVLARGGEPMLRLILASLETTDNDLDYRDGLVVIADMQHRGTYRVCADSALLAKLESYRDRIGNADWRAFYGNELRKMCEAGPAR